MKEKLKQKLKKIVVPIFLSVICGGLCGNLVYSIYDDKTDTIFTNNMVYLLQSGAYSSYDNMRANAIGLNYVYYEDGGLYKTIIGITRDSDNIEKIKSTYKDEIIVSKYIIDDIDLCKKIGEYDKLLKNMNNEEEIKKIVFSMLDLYKQDKDIKLAKIE